MYVSTALAESGFTEDTIGLSVFVHLKATQWLGDCPIISQVLPLVDALKVHTQLLCARKKSWTALRAEWIGLIRAKKYVSETEAASIADNTHRAALACRFATASRRAQRALRTAATRVRKVANQIKREHRAISKAAAAIIICDRKAILLQKKAWNDQRKLIQKLGFRNLITEDLMRSTTTKPGTWK